MKLPPTPTVAAPRPRPQPHLSPPQLATAWQAISLLLDYPQTQLRDHLPMLRQECATLPLPVAQPLVEFLDALPNRELPQWQRDYVETFDHTRRCCLYLTYFTHGDTRGRGVALVQLKQAYRRAGVEFAANELPDHLAVVLEFGAAYDAAAAWRLLTTHRAGIEMLRLALQQRESPWLPVVQALCATLPPLDGAGHEAVQRLIAQGPPNEEVGLEMTAYAMDPSLRADEQPQFSAPTPAVRSPQ